MRELRQHASRYLARVQAGESFHVTDRGRRVARLVPADDDPWDDLVAAGVVTPAAEGYDLLDVVPVESASGVVTGSEALAELRADER